MSDGAPYDKSIQASANALRELTKAGEKSGSYLTTVFGPAINEVAEWTHEFVAHKREKWRDRKKWEEKNLCDILSQMAINAPQDISQIKSLPDRLQTRIIEGASNEDNHIIQSYWVKILTAATNSERNFDIGKLHLKVLENIDEIDVLIIESVANFLINRDHEIVVLLGSDIINELKIDNETLEAHMFHLTSLGCFRARDNSVGLLIEHSPYYDISVQTEYGTYDISALLFSIIKATHNRPDLKYAISRPKDT
ncbi:hypothetical protein [Methylobacterium indicum]|uniref:hypothetical protein n=1 Tax=Methylobacterium indicum TaxID=1775910 RepID=UPI000AE08771|nr:hypothetical protein [Methylobacterium indicum]